MLAVITCKQKGSEPKFNYCFRFLSQDCFDDLADKSDSSPLFRLRQQADDGLSSCTSLASHDYDNTSFYEGDDDLSAKANKDGRGSPDTLNGSNEVTQLVSTSVCYGHSCLILS